MTETAPDKSPEEITHHDVLFSRPVLPVGRPDIVELEALAANTLATEPGYAWERLPLWLAKVEEVYKGIGNRPIITLDLGSSVPLYAQYLRTYEFSRSGTRARELARTFFGDRALASMRGAESGYLRPIATAVSRDSTCRGLLEGAIQEMLYQLTPTEANPSQDDASSVEAAFSDHLASQSLQYVEERSNTGRVGGRGLHFAVDQSELSYKDTIAQLRIPTMAAYQAGLRLRDDYTNALDREIAQSSQPIGQELAAAYIEWQAAHLALQIRSDAARYKPARFLSFDSSNPFDVALSGIQAMPLSTQALDLFPHAIKSLQNPNQHLVGNLFEPLPLPDDSLALITCFDSWPFHFQSDPNMHGENADFHSVAVKTLGNFYKKLAPGGKIVIFPWNIYRQNYSDIKKDEKILNRIRTAFGASIQQLTYTARGDTATLRGMMSIADRETAEQLSPILPQSSEYLEALIITKPNQSAQSAVDSWKMKAGNLAVRAE